MATTTRRKLSLPADPWRQTETVEMINGVLVNRWEHENGDVRLVRPGLHPDDQPLSNAPTVFNDEAQEPDIEETATDRVATLLQQAAGQERAELNVYRIVNGTREYCAKYLPEEFEEGTFELLRKNFGAGEYELRLYATHPESKKFVVRSSTRVKIAQGHALPEPSGMPAGMSQVLTTIAQGQEHMLRALVEMKQAPQKDPMEEMTKMLSMMTMMREAMGLNVQQRQEKSSIGEIVAAIKELKGAASELVPTPEEKEPDSLMGMMPKVLELISAGQQAQQMQPQQMQPPIMPVHVPQSFDQPQQPQQPTQENDMNIMTMIKLKGYLKSLTDLAVSGADIEKGAQFVYDNLPDDLIDLMALPNWFELLSSVASEVKPHVEWMQKVRDLALTMFDAPEPDDSGNAAAN